ncbi:hypothetical protein [Paenibacillus sp. FSL H3-0286]|uniref:hypothetical protein n=1 Tax=Paenibacillus sp. FSL H3-0286 TaxID=2921427 RepID=UPI0032497104
MRKYDDDEKEEQSIIMWIERRLEYSDSGMIKYYWDMYKKMWKESFGDSKPINKEFELKVKDMYTDRKKVESLYK